MDFLRDFDMEQETFIMREHVESKNNQESKKFRQEGNAKYKKTKIFDAILNYNKAIAFAETEEDLAFAYGNRSAAYFEVGKYKECLKSIELAKEAGFPSNKMKQLNEREEKCKKLMTEETDVPENVFWNYIKLSYPANEKIPWLIEGLEIRITEDVYQGIYATCDLKVGDIICIEESKIQTINYKGLFKCCNYCAKSNMMNLIPCLKTASFMFCSTDCRNEFYKYADLDSDMFCKSCLLVNKMKDVFGGEENFLEYINNDQLSNIFDFDLSDSNHPDYWLNIYKCFLSSGPDVIMEKIVDNAINVFHYKHENEVLEKEYSHTSIGDLAKRSKIEKICFSTFYALLNHSCVPNVDFVCIINTAVFYVIKPIKKDEQLFLLGLGDSIKERIELNLTYFLLTPSCHCITHIAHFMSHKHLLCQENFQIEDIEQFTKIFHIDISSVASVSHAIEIITYLFDILNNCKKPISIERVVAEKFIKNIFFFLADLFMFPAQKSIPNFYPQ